MDYTFFGKQANVTRVLWDRSSGGDVPDYSVETLNMSGVTFIIYSYTLYTILSAKAVARVNTCGVFIRVIQLMAFVSTVALLPVSGLQQRGSILSVGTIKLELSQDIVMKCAIFDYRRKISVTAVAQSGDMYCTVYSDGDRVQEIHQLNPGVVCLLYRNVRDVSDYYVDEWNMALQKGWICKDRFGNLVHNVIWPELYLLDVGNPEYQELVANWIKKYCDQYGFDGTFLDNGLCANLYDYAWDASTQFPINPRTSNVWTHDEIQGAYIELINKIKEKINPKPVICNGIFRGETFFGPHNQRYVDILLGSKIDGFMSEGLWYNYDGEWYSEERWLDSLNLVVWTENNFLNKSNKFFIPNCDSLQFTLPPGSTEEQMAKYVFCSQLLGLKNNNSFLNLRFTILEAYGKELFETNIGHPLGNYYMIEGTHVYARNLSNSTLFVNPTNNNYTLNVGGRYIILDAHTGNIVK